MAADGPANAARAVAKEFAKIKGLRLSPRPPSPVSIDQHLAVTIQRAAYGCEITERNAVKWIRTQPPALRVTMTGVTRLPSFTPGRVCARFDRFQLPTASVDIHLPIQLLNPCVEFPKVPGQLIHLFLQSRNLHRGNEFHLRFGIPVLPQAGCFHNLRQQVSFLPTASRSASAPARVICSRSGVRTLVRLMVSNPETAQKLDQVRLTARPGLLRASRPPATGGPPGRPLVRAGRGPALPSH